MLLEYAEGSFERMGHRLRQLRGTSRGERGEGLPGRAANPFPPLSSPGTNGPLARWGNSRPPTSPLPCARPVIQGVVENGYALVYFGS